jgi:hypothetical protein
MVYVSAVRQTGSGDCPSAPYSLPGSTIPTKPLLYSGHKAQSPFVGPRPGVNHFSLQYAWAFSKSLDKTMANRRVFQPNLRVQDSPARIHIER